MTHIGGETRSAEGSAGVGDAFGDFLESQRGNIDHDPGSAGVGGKTPGKLVYEAVPENGWAWGDVPNDLKEHYEAIAAAVLAGPLAEIAALKARLENAESFVAMTIPVPSPETVASLAACSTTERAVHAAIMWARASMVKTPASQVLKDGELDALNQIAASVHVMCSNDVWGGVTDWIGLQSGCRNLYAIRSGCVELEDGKQINGSYRPDFRVFAEKTVTVPAKTWDVAQMLANAWELAPLMRNEAMPLIREWAAIRSKKGSA